MNDNRLTSKEMAHFVASGYLRFEQMVPKELCEACLEEIREHKGYFAVGTPFEVTWAKNMAFGDAFRLPQVQGLIYPLASRSRPALRPPRSASGQGAQDTGARYAPGLGHRLRRQ